MIINITTIEDVKIFAKELIEEGCNFHPDDDFLDFQSNDTGAPAYTIDEAKHRNDLMTECFLICENEGKDIYSIMSDILLTETGMLSYIPLSTDQPS